MKVLIATDDSPASWDAIEFASRLTDADDDIVVVNVTSVITTRCSSRSVD